MNCLSWRVWMEWDELCEKSGELSCVRGGATEEAAAAAEARCKSKDKNLTQWCGEYDGHILIQPFTEHDVLKMKNWRVRPYTCKKPMAPIWPGGSNRGLPDGKMAKSKLLRFQMVLVPAYSPLKQKSHQLAHPAFFMKTHETTSAFQTNC